MRLPLQGLIGNNLLAYLLYVIFFGIDILGESEIVGKVLNRTAYIACIVYATHEELSDEVIFIREGKGVLIGW